jgi:asparagine synthase (glutamine-hydrolysing)
MKYYLIIFTVFTPDAQSNLFQRDFYHKIAGSDPYKNANELLHTSNACKFLHQMLYADVNMYLVELLMKQDQMSMAASIESRVPFLDHILVEFAGTVPPYLRLRGRQGNGSLSSWQPSFCPFRLFIVLKWAHAP